MSLDRFIGSIRAEVAKRFDLKTDAEIDAFFIGMKESAKDNQEALEKRDKMLRDTVEELYNVKRLLESASKIVKNLPCDDDNCSECVHNDNGHILCSEYDCFEWRYTDEFKKLYDPIIETEQTSEVAKKSYEYQAPEEYLDQSVNKEE